MYKGGLYFISHHTKKITDGVLFVRSLHVNDQKKSMDYPGELGGGHTTIFTIQSINLDCWTTKHIKDVCMIPKIIDV